MSKAMSGLIGAFAGGLEGYSAGKLGEVKNFQESNMMLIKDIMDRKNKEFEHRLGLERIGVEDQYARGRMELGQDFDVENMKSSQFHDLDMAEKEFKRQLERDTIQFGRQFALEKYQQSMANKRASMSAGTRAKFNDYINPTTGETRQISEGDFVPQGFFPASYAASTGKSEKFDPEVEEYKLGRKRNALLSKFGMVGDEVGNVFVKGREGLSEKEAEQFVRAADKAGFYVDIQKSDKWFEENVYVPTSLVPKEVDDSPAGRPIIGNQAKADLSRVENKNGMDILNMTIDKFGNEVPPEGAKPQRVPQSNGIVGSAKPENKPKLEVEWIDDGTSFADIMGGGDKAKATIPATINGRTMEIPLAVPTLTEREFNSLKAGKEPTPEMIQKAVRHAEEKVGAGKSPMDTGGGSVVERLIDRYRRNVDDPEVKKKLRGEDKDSKLRKSFLRTPPTQQ